MKTVVLKGSKREIADSVARIEGDVREAIVFVAEASDSTTTASGDDLFVEMTPYMVDVPEIDDSREAIYSGVEE